MDRVNEKLESAADQINEYFTSGDTEAYGRGVELLPYPASRLEDFHESDSFKQDSQIDIPALRDNGGFTLGAYDPRLKSFRDFVEEQDIVNSPNTVHSVYRSGIPAGCVASSELDADHEVVRYSRSRGDEEPDLSPSFNADDPVVIVDDSVDTQETARELGAEIRGPGVEELYLLTANDRIPGKDWARNAVYSIEDEERTSAPVELNRLDSREHRQRDYISRLM